MAHTFPPLDSTFSTDMNELADKSDLDVEKYGTGHSWDENEYAPLTLNHEALTHIAECYLPGDHGKCIEIHTVERGSFHEIRVLEFEDGFSCIGRFTRNPKEQLCILESEVATVKYVHEHTTVPVPQTYFVNFDPTHAVGAQFVLMERMPGINLYAIWPKLTTAQKLEVLDQIADVLVQLSCLKFDKIGSIDLSGATGPLQNQVLASSHREDVRGPFETMEQYMLSFVQEGCELSPEMKALYEDVRRAIQKDLAQQADDPLYNGPFRLIHGDFDGQNMLFTWPDRSQSPRLSGIIDWDYSFAGPLYYLYDYPIFIQDNEVTEETRKQYDENKVLRKHFVRSLAQKFPKGSNDREDVREAFVQKNFALHGFQNLFITSKFRFVDEEKYYLRGYAEGLEGIGNDLHPYAGRSDWEADSELESDDEEGEATSGPDE